MSRPLPPRTVIDRYMVEKTFAVSASAVTYLVEDMQVGRRFFLTEFFPAASAQRAEGESGAAAGRIVPKDAEAFARQKALYREAAERFGARDYAALIKPVRTFEANGTLYLASPYGGERPFEACFGEAGTIAEGKLYPTFSPLFNLLQSLHNRGETLKDLSPQSLVVCENGALALTCFAASEAPEEGYASPEHYASDRAKMTPRSDLYALGALLYRLMTARTPAGGRARLKAVLLKNDDPYVPLQPLQASEALCTLVNAALSLEAEARPASVYAFETVLHAPAKTVRAAYDTPSAPVPSERKPKTSLLRLGTIAAAAAVLYVFLINTSPGVIKADELSGFDILRYRWAALWGDVKAQKALGHIYESGLGVDKDRDKAVSWYKKAADQGDYYAMVILDDLRTGGTAGSDTGSPEPGRYAERIRNTAKKNPRAVFEMYYEQAQSGSATGQYNLAYAYAKGIGAPKDQVKASYYLRKAADQGDTESLMWMGSRYFFGKGVRKNNAEAAKAFTQAAKQGHVTAMEWLGYLYQTGKGLQQDVKLGAHWHRKAAEAGNTLAAYNLGLCYETGRGVPRDTAKALLWLRRAADKGYRDAVSAIGRLYYRSAARGRSRDVKGDYEQAKRWFSKAQRLGDPAAKSFLAAIEREQNGATKGTAARQSVVRTQNAGHVSKASDASAQTMKRRKRLIEETVKVERERRRGFPGKRYARFIDRGEYVQDTKTGLLWQKDGRASGRRNYYQAADYAKSLSLGGLLGWRVPTRRELASIFPARRAPFTNTPYTSKPCCKGPYEWHSYWTADLDKRLPDYAYVYHWYGRGGPNNCYASKNYDYVRVVHDPIANTAYLRTTYSKAW